MSLVMPPNLRSIEVISETPQGRTQEEENQQGHQEKAEVALKSVNDQQQGWRLRVRKLVPSNEYDCENRGCQDWEPIRYPFDDFPCRHVTRTPRDRVTPRRRQVISKIAVSRACNYRCARTGLVLKRAVMVAAVGTSGCFAVSSEEAGRKVISLLTSKLFGPDAFLKRVAAVKKQFDQL